ncbi:hypothetical protein EDC01DRAFT_776435 [Geopyxis carbonaria]|nr:hypothetical protein EDC01DRAFT_776435 [Geopyxis carbonaria]
MFRPILPVVLLLVLAALAHAQKGFPYKLTVGTYKFDVPLPTTNTSVSVSKRTSQLIIGDPRNTGFPSYTPQPHGLTTSKWYVGKALYLSPNKTLPEGELYDLKMGYGWVDDQSLAVFTPSGCICGGNCGGACLRFGVNLVSGAWVIPSSKNSDGKSGGWPIQYWNSTKNPATLGLRSVILWRNSWN